MKTLDLELHLPSQTFSMGHRRLHKSNGEWGVTSLTKRTLCLLSNIIVLNFRETNTYDVGE